MSVNLHLEVIGGVLMKCTVVKVWAETVSMAG